MNPLLTSPAVCVIDDEEEEYGPVLAALMELGIGCVHIRGGNGDVLPPEPFDAIRLVFSDLHLSGHVGKAAASHTANVFRKVVSAEAGPVLVVIWSKYAQDKTGEDGVPVDDQPTEADLFKEAVLAAEPKFRTRLFFVEMPKPKLPDRPATDEWIGVLKGEVQAILARNQAFDALWSWEASLRKAGTEINELLVGLAESSVADGESIGERLNLILRLLAQQQGGPDNSDATAYRHLLTVFAQIAVDVVEARAADDSKAGRSAWLANPVTPAERKTQKLAKLNSFLHTSKASPTHAKYVPGTVYQVIDPLSMQKMTGFSLAQLQEDCFEDDATKISKDFRDKTDPIFVELTPACDFHQGSRRSTILLAGLIWPADLKKVASKDACKKTVTFEDRYLAEPKDVGLVFCSRFRFTFVLDPEQDWLRPRFRLREPLMMDIKGWHAAQVSRTGYLSFF